MTTQLDILQPCASVFLQPHHDDVPLSCGGTVAAYVAAGQECHIVTVFGGEVVEAMVGELAAKKHARWQLEASEVSNRRRSEDDAAIAVLGADLRWLGFPDAIYRGDRYVDESVLFGPIHPEEAALAELIANEVLALPEWQPNMRVFVSLGIGDHVDHQIVFNAGRILAARGHSVFAYEDCPYAIHSPERSAERHAAVGNMIKGKHCVAIDQTIDRKLRSIACYQSQLSVIFRFTNDYATAVRGFALSDDGNLLLEWFWRVSAD